MFQILKSSNYPAADVSALIKKINTPNSKIASFFDKNAKIFISRAPGRLDVMGGIADYSGSLVLEMPIREATVVAVQKNTGSQIQILSFSSTFDRSFSFESKVNDLIDENNTDFKKIGQLFSSKKGSSWPAYISGVFPVLAAATGFDFQKGCKILVCSQIPVGKGVSSSAALEVATMTAVCTAFGIKISSKEIAILCQRVENEIVGAPCGIMDQITVSCGQENELLPIICQPAEILGSIPIPESLDLWGIDSGVRHAVAGSDYGSVRVGAFMGYRIICEAAGMKSRQSAPGLVEIDDTKWHGYLANVPADEYENEFASAVPNKIKGAEFLRKFGGSTDRVTQIDPAKTYAVKAPTEHGIYENSRVNKFYAGLKGDADPADLGSMMFQSHASYKRCGLTETCTDRIVELVRENSEKGLYGARITGGGSGGTVAVLGRRGAGDVIEEISKQFEAETGNKPCIFHGSSPGADRFDHVVLGPIGNGR